MRKDNRGLSLVELMAVIAILAVVGSVIGFSLNAMLGKPAQQCAQQVVYSIERHRMTAMGKVSAEYVLKVDSTTGEIVAEEYVSNTSTLSTSPDQKASVGASGVAVSYVAGGTTYDLSTNPLKLRFDRSSGAFKPLADGTYCTSIIIKKGGREHIVTLVPLTGKVYID